MWVICANCTHEASTGMSLIVSHTGEPLTLLPPGEEALGKATINLALTKDWEPWRSRVRGWSDR